MQGVYVTRDSGSRLIDIWPRLVGIRAFPGCVVYGAAWNSQAWTTRLYTNGMVRYVKRLNAAECRERYGFYPRKGTAWWVPVKGKRKQEFLAFSP